MWSSSRRARLAALAAVVAAAGVLWLVGAGPLARTAPAGRSASGVEPLPPPARSATAAVADLVVSVSVAPNRPGVNAFTVLVASSRRPPPAPVGVVVLDVGGAARLTLTRTAPGEFTGTGRLDRAGPVRITALVSRGSQRLSAPTSWSVDPPLPAQTGPASGRPAAGQPTSDTGSGSRLALELLAVPLLGAVILGIRRWSRRRAAAAGSELVAAEPTPTAAAAAEAASPAPAGTAEPASPEPAAEEPAGTAERVLEGVQ